MQKEVINWGLSVEENGNLQKPYSLFLHYQEENVMKKQKINMWYYDNTTGYFQFVNNHDYTFLASINTKHISITLADIDQIFTIKHARRLHKPAQIRENKVKFKNDESMELN